MQLISEEHSTQTHGKGDPQRHTSLNAARLLLFVVNKQTIIRQMHKIPQLRKHL